MVLEEQINENITDIIYLRFRADNKLYHKFT